MISYRLLYLLVSLFTTAFILFIIRFPQNNKEHTTLSVSEVHPYKDVEKKLLGMDLSHPPLKDSPFYPGNNTFCPRLPLDLICHGILQKDNLLFIHKDAAWLKRILHKKSFFQIEEIDRGILNKSGIVEIVSCEPKT